MPVPANVPSRYADNEMTLTPLDQFEDVTNFIKSFAASEYLKSILIERHGRDDAAAESCSKIIIPHVQAALDFIQQARSGPETVSFLPCYYAILNLLKIYVLLGPHAADLTAQRHHGASYDPNAVVPTSLLDDTFALKRRGVIPLFFRTVTGTEPRERIVKIGDIYPYIEEISSEYSLAEKKPTKLCALKVDRYVPLPSGNLVRPHFLTVGWTSTPPEVGDIPLLRGAWERNGQRYVGPPQIPTADSRENIRRLRVNLRCELIHLRYDFGKEHEGVFVTPICTNEFLMVQEVPIVLMFFYLSNIVRYRPEIMQRLMASKYWPVVNSARRHSLFTAMKLFWSYMHQSNMQLRGG